MAHASPSVEPRVSVSSDFRSIRPTGNAAATLTLIVPISNGGDRFTRPRTVAFVRVPPEPHEARRSTNALKVKHIGKKDHVNLALKRAQRRVRAAHTGTGTGKPPPEGAGVSEAPRRAGMPELTDARTTDLACRQGPCGPCALAAARQPPQGRRAGDGPIRVTRHARRSATGHRLAAQTDRCIGRQT